jgi:Ca-activated chloride channel family protein
MQWEKLERSFEALETLLRTLHATDRFSLVLFNSETERLPVTAANPADVQHALELVRASRLRAGTDLEKALETGLDEAASPHINNAYLVRRLVAVRWENSDWEWTRQMP